jgi:hypothetical protein
MGAIALAVLAFDAFTWYVFALLCGIGENFRAPFVELCGRNQPQAQVHLPMLGAAVVVAGVVVATRTRRYRLFGVAIVIGFASAAALWALYGDPAGNFRGLLG